ncbi:MAG: ABC transporter substrate-binding protein, partial [Acidimicrobiia bacterium]
TRAPSAGAAPIPGPAGTPGAAGEIRLGSVGVASGPIGAAVAPIAEGARAWVADVNARGGIGGRKVRLFQADDGGDPARSVAIVKRLVEQEQVAAFYSNFMVTTEEAVVRYLEDQQVPAIGGCSCSSAVDASPMLFPIGPGAPLGEAWAHVLPFLTQTDKRKASIFYCREAANCSVMQSLMGDIAAEAGFTVVHQAQVSIAQPDYTAEVLAASSAGADVIVGLMDNASLVRVAKSAHRQGYNPAFSIQQSGFDDALLSQADEVEGFVTAGIVPDHNMSPKLADFRAALARYLPSQTGSWTP